MLQVPFICKLEHDDADVPCVLNFKIDQIKEKEIKKTRDKLLIIQLVQLLLLLFFNLKFNLWSKKKKKKLSPSIDLSCELYKN